MKHKTFRVLLSLVLVCVLLIGWSPIRAQASALPEVAGVVTKVIPFAKVVEPAALGVGGTVFCWVALGLGLVFTAKEAVDAYNRYQDFTGDLEMAIYYYPDGSWSYGVDMTFVERVREFLWESGTLTVLPPVAHEMTTAQSTAMVSFMNEYSHVFCWVFNNEWHFAASNAGYFSVSPKNTWHRLVCHAASGLTSFKVWTMSSTATNPGSYSLADTQNLWEGSVWFWCGPDDEPTIHSVHDLGVVAPRADPFSDGYPDWYINSRPATNPDTDEEITVLPIPLTPGADPETQIGSLIQSDIWHGSLADPMPDSGTDPAPDSGTDGSLSQTPWETFKKWISEGWQSIIQAIPTPESIAEAVGNVIKSIFVPDADFISDKWNSIRSRFDFADSISSSGELILDVLNGINPEPPVIYVDLGDAEGSYYLGGQVAFLDLRWYERYKPTGDAIISAFLWLVFVWRMFIKLPGIVAGLPGDFVMQGVTDLGFADWLPARKKEYENQRQENRRFFKK